MGEVTVQAGSNSDKVVISFRDVYAAYEQIDVLEGITLDIYDGEFVALIGPNGGGKTTLIKLVLGLLKPARGSIRVLGQAVERARRHVAHVPQDIRFDNDFPVTAREVVRMGRLGRRRLLQRYTTEDDRIVQSVLDQVGARHLADRPIGELSGGERQRVYIARALAGEPAILLLDEPLSNVDPQAREVIQELLPSLGEALTIVMSSHDVGAVLPQVDKIGYLHRHLDYYGRPENAPAAVHRTFRCPVDTLADSCPCGLYAPQAAAEGAQQ